MRLSLARLSRFPVLLLLIFTASCALRDPDGTSWTTALSVEAQPETLRVSRALESPAAELEGDSLLIFRQELDPTYSRLGDSLHWEGVEQSLRLEVGPLDLHGLGDAQLALPFSLAWPAYAGQVGTTTQLSGQANFSQTLTLPDWPEMEWVAYSDARFRLDLLHHWPFALQWLEIELVNAQGQVLGMTHWEPAQGLPAEQALQSSLQIQGTLTRASQLRLRGRHLPMSAPALISDGNLTLGLTQTMGLADSARVRPPALSFVWSDSLWSGSRLRILRALTEPARLRLNATNELPVPVQFQFGLPQLRTAAGDWIEMDLNVPAGGLVHRQLDPGALQIEDAEGLDWLAIQGSAQTTAAGGLVTVHASDALVLDLGLDPLALEEFEGWFLEDLRVPFESSETTVEDWPTELVALDLEGLTMRLHLDNQGGVNLQGHFELRALESRVGRADTTFISDLELQASDTLLLVAGADRLVSRLPGRLQLSGEYRVPAGTIVNLERGSQVGMTALSLPARARVGQLQWQSLPEWHSDALPAEASQLRLLGEVENRLPAGGTVWGWVASTLNGERVELFEMSIAAADWSQGAVTPRLSQVELELSEDALAVLRGAEWILWYEFQAEEMTEVVEIRADQWLAVRARIQVLVDVEVGGGNE
jgi:hypothetical protein